MTSASYDVIRCQSWQPKKDTFFGVQVKRFCAIMLIKLYYSYPSYESFREMFASFFDLASPSVYYRQRSRKRLSHRYGRHVGIMITPASRSKGSSYESGSTTILSARVARASFGGGEKGLRPGSSACGGAPHLTVRGPAPRWVGWGKGGVPWGLAKICDDLIKPRLIGDLIQRDHVWHGWCWQSRLHGGRQCDVLPPQSTVTTTVTW